MDANKEETHIQREFPMSNENFAVLQDIAFRSTGISLSEHKKELVYSRIARRIRTLNLQSFNDYIDYLQNYEEQELSDFINSITTNLTSFFREAHHFEFLKNTALPELKERKGHLKKARIWSAGCSTGEEPYSIAITLKESMFPASWDTLILATDLDSNVLNHGKQGTYDRDRIDGLDVSIKKKWFYQNAAAQNSVNVKEDLQDMIRFNRLNLMESWPMKVKFDVIFCRNVVIYFNKDTQKHLFNRFANQLEDGGYLFLGHSESLHGVSDRFKSIGKTIYQKIGG